MEWEAGGVNAMNLGPDMNPAEQHLPWMLAARCLDGAFLAAGCARHRCSFLGWDGWG